MMDRVIGPLKTAAEFARREMAIRRWRGPLRPTGANNGTSFDKCSRASSAYYSSGAPG